MWKKMVVSLIALIGTFSVALALNHEMNATTTLTAGGTVIGRIGNRYTNSRLSYTADPSITDQVYGMQKGDKVYLGDQEKLGWQLLSYDTDVEGSAWLSFANHSLMNIAPTEPTDLFTDGTSNLHNTGFLFGSSTVRVLPYKYTKLSRVMQLFNTDLKLTKAYNEVITNRKMVREDSLLSLTTTYTHYPYQIQHNKEVEIGKTAFIPSLVAYGDPTYFEYPLSGNPMYIKDEDLTFSEKYISTDNQDFQNYNGTSLSFRYFTGTNANSQTTDSIGSFVGDATNENSNFYSDGVMAVRPAIYLDLKNSIFATGIGNGSDSLTKIERTNLNSNYTSLYDETKDNAEMIVRIYDDNNTLSFDGFYANDDSTAISKTTKDSKVKLHITTNAYSSLGNNTISAIIFNTDGEFVYYKPISTLTNETSYIFDLTGLPVGTYHIGFVNETLTGNSTDIIPCSDITPLQVLEITEGHSISYKKAPQSGASDGVDYEYSKNVNAGDTIGKVNGDGTTKIFYELTSFDGTDTSFENFEIAGLDATDNSSSSISLDLKIKENAKDIVSSTKSLKVGAYKFCIVSKDANGLPDTPTDKTKVCVELEVKKTQPSVSYNTKKKTNVKIGDANITEQITYTNNELKVGEAVPSYVLTGGTTGTGLDVTGNPNVLTDYDISVGSTSVPSIPATFTLTVTTPETDNYLSATATKEIMVYKDLSALTWTPAKGSFSPSDVTSGKTVGTLEAVGGYGPFTYELVKTTDPQYDATKGKDNGKFSISSTAIPSGTQDVKTNTALGAGDYYVQYKVTDSLGNTAYKTAVIQVVANAQAALQYKDKAGGNVITSFSLTYPDATKSLLAEGGSGTGAITYAFAPTQPSGITNASDYLTVGPSNGSLTPLKPGTVTVRATKAGDATYSSTYVDIPVTILPATQILTWSGTNVTQVSGTSDTWQMETYWSGGSDTYDIEELLNSATLSKDLGISSNVSGATTTVPFTLSLIANSADSAKVALANNTITITGTPTGIVQIKAERNGEQGYGNSAPAYLNLKIKTLPEIKFTYDVANGCSGSMAAASTCTLSSNKKIGDLSLDPATTGYTYSIKTSEYDSTGTGNSYSTAPGIFTIADTSEVKLNSNLNNGIYRITFSATDGTYTLKDHVITITISNNAFNTATWTWDAGDVGSLASINGNMDGTTNEYTGVYQRTYAPAVSGVKDKFEVELKGIPAGASVSYKVRDNSDPNVIAHAANAIFDVEGAGGKNGSTSTVFVEATVSKSGYSDVSVYLPVEIKKYPQTIGFANNNVIYLPNNGVCTTIPAASVTSTNSNYANPGNPITYKEDASSSGAIKVNGNQICSKSGTTATSAKVVAELDGDTNYEKATATKNVILYAPGSITVSQSIQSITGGASNITYTEGTHIVAHDSAQSKNGTADKDEVVANVKLTGMAGSAVYTLSTNSNTANEDKIYFEVNPTSGNITLKQDITASDLFAHQPSGNTFYIQVDVKDPHGFVQTVDVQIVIDDAIAEFYFHDGGAKLPLTGAGSGIYVDNLTGVAKYSESYVQNGTITRIETNRGDATYSVDTDPQADPDVIQFVSGNTYRIQNATDEQAVYKGHGGKAYAKACIPAGNGYQAQCIYAEVEITKAEQTGFAFAQDPLNLASTSGSITPLYKNHKDGQDVLISNSSDPTIVDAGTYTQGSDQEIQIFKEGGPVTITAKTEGNRNYESATATTTVNVSAKPPTTLTVDVNPKPIYYGDTTATATINAGYKSGTPAYFSSSDPSIVEVNDSSTGNNASDALIIKKVGTVDIEVCQTNQAGFTAGDTCPTDGDYGYKTITVQPREITLKIKDETIYTGEAFPAYAFETSPTSGSFAGSDTIIDFPLPVNTKAMDGTNILSKSDTIGTYPIQGEYSSAEKTDPFLSNYKITIQDGSLTIKQDASDTAWYYLEGVASGNQPLDPAKWYNEDIYVKIDPANSTESAGSYDQISDTSLFTNADKTKYLVSNEDDNTKDVYFRIDPNGGTAHAGAISSKQTTSVKIDKTAPKVTGAKGTPSTNNLLEDLINVVSFNTFFKPGVEVILHTEDPQPQGSTQTVSVSGVKDVDYTIYEVDEKTGVVDASKTPTTGNGSVDANGEIKFNIPKIGAYKVCAIAHDNAGNPSGEECYYVNVKKINIDLDDDGEPDLNDPDGDGCPDLNIVLGTDSSGNKVKLNVAEKGKKYPYMNIDSDGDGKPDLNIDTDHDGKPDLNLVILTEKDSQGTPAVWNPKKCVVVDKLKDYSEPIEYCTGTDVKAIINVDTDDNHIPDINIDNVGDFKPHINISKNDKDPYLNITPIHIWKPEKNYTKDGLAYDSIGEEVKAITNIDSNEDGIPDLNIDFEGNGVPSLNIDTNGDGIPDMNIDGDGDGKPDYNVDVKGNGKDLENLVQLDQWNPIFINEKNDLQFGTMEIKNKDQLEDQGIIVEKPDGNFLPKYALKVEDITISAGKDIKEALADHASEKQIQGIYHVSVTENGDPVEIGDKVKVRIPVDKKLRNPAILIQQKDGNYLPVNAQIEDGYYVFETDYLGIVAILSDVEKGTENPPTNDPEDPSTVLPSPDSGGTSNTPTTTVKGNYTNSGGVGGASTGDTVSLVYILGMGCTGLVMLSISYRQLRKK